MNDLEEMLRGELPPGVIYPPAISVGPIVALAYTYGWTIRDVELENVSTKQDFLDAWAAGLDFPDWRGHNWDAFEELLADLSWLGPVRGCIVCVNDLGATPPHDVAVGMRIVEEVVASQPEHAPVPLIVIAV